jgi:hypothetical protein
MSPLPRDQLELSGVKVERVQGGLVLGETAPPHSPHEQIVLTAGPLDAKPSRVRGKEKWLPGLMSQSAVVRDYRALEVGRRRANRLVLTVAG